MVVKSFRTFGPGLGIGEVSWMRETTLGGNRWKDEVTRLDWKVAATKATDDGGSNAAATGKAASQAFEVLLGPLEIRTMVVEFKSV